MCVNPGEAIWARKILLLEQALASDQVLPEEVDGHCLDVRLRHLVHEAVDALAQRLPGLFLVSD